MRKINFFITIIVSFIFAVTLTTTVSALDEWATCKYPDGTPIKDSQGKIQECDAGLSCTPVPITNQAGNFTLYNCQKTTISSIFGRIELPPAIRNLGKGSAAISLVLSNIVTLIFVAAGIVFIFMIVISAFQWIVSGGDKEAVAKARGRLTAAIIGIVILSLTFVIANFIGEITGFKF